MFEMIRSIKFECAIFCILGVIVYILSEWFTEPPLTYLLLLGYSSGAALWIIGRVRYVLLQLQAQKSEQSRGAI